MTTQNEIRAWLDEAKEKNATHLIVACDTFDHEDYPVYVMPGENARKKAKLGSMQKVMEVYSMALPIEDQMNEPRAFHWD